ALATPLPATLTPVGPCYALAESSAAVGRRSTRGSTRTSTAAPAPRRPTADSDSARMMELVERAQAGEADAFGRLYDQYSDTVYRYIYYRVGGKATAEDLTSETFLRALRRIS
ncbi:sigma factor, partial [Streptomyces beijiangensis]